MSRLDREESLRRGTELVVNRPSGQQLGLVQHGELGAKEREAAGIESIAAQDHLVVAHPHRREVGIRARVRRDRVDEPRPERIAVVRHRQVPGSRRRREADGGEAPSTRLGIEPYLGSDKIASSTCRKAPRSIVVMMSKLLLSQMRNARFTTSMTCPGPAAT